MHNQLSTKDGWRVDRTSPSLPESHRTIAIAPGAGFWRKLLAFSGPGYLVAVGYMDPGNWATDLAGGSGFGYTLLSIILLSNLMAILLQALCARLGIATQRDLAQACHDHYSQPVSFALWIICELAICACDLAEVIGSAIALNLLFKIPLVIGVCITALDVLAVLYLQNKGFRYIEALVVVLILTIGGCFLFEVIFSKPELRAVLGGFAPHSEIIRNRDMLYIAIGILGATVMPHNLYLHSSVVQTRNYEQSSAGKSEAIKFATIDSSVALMFALFINAAILIVAAATFHSHGQHDVAEIQDAYKLLSPTLGIPIASALFASCLRPKLDPDRNAGRPDRDGRFSQHPVAPVAAALDHTPHRNYPRRDYRRSIWCKRHGEVAVAQSGHSQSPTFLCRDPAGPVHERPAENGSVRFAPLAANIGLDHNRGNCFTKWKISL